MALLLTDHPRSNLSRAALAMLAIIGLLWSWSRWSEPRYLERGVRSWIEQLPYDNSNNSEAQEAMRFFGDRAMPYLLEAMVRPEKWQTGWLSKIPRRYLSRVIDLRQQSDVRRAAIGRLQELAREEVERNELELSPAYPVIERILPVWRKQLQDGASPDVLFGLVNLGPKVTNVATELATTLQRLKPGEWEWSQAAQLLAEANDPKFTPLFLRFAASTNKDDIREWAIYALGRNGHTNTAIADAIRPALLSTNERLRNTALLASASLNLCGTEALGVIQKRRDQVPYVGPKEMHVFDIIEPILRWRLNPQDPAATSWIEKNLTANTSASLFQTLRILESTGPAAKQFVPAITRVAFEQGAPLRVPAIRALRAIDPAEVPKVLPSIPRVPVVHARSARASR